MQIRTKPVGVSSRAFSVIEVLVAMAVAAVLFTGFYLALSFGFKMVGGARENLRATQIMMEKLEAIRLCTWDQLTNTTYVPRYFTNYYYPGDTNRMGVAYYGEIEFTKVPFTTSYTTDMTNIVVRVRWTNGVVEVNREMQTFVAREGLQRYIYGYQ